MASSHSISWLLVKLKENAIGTVEDKSAGKSNGVLSKLDLSESEDDNDDDKHPIRRNLFNLVQVPRVESIDGISSIKSEK